MRTLIYSNGILSLDDSLRIPSGAMFAAGSQLASTISRRALFIPLAGTILFPREGFTWQEQQESLPYRLRDGTDSLDDGALSEFVSYSLKEIAILVENHFEERGLPTRIMQQINRTYEDIELLENEEEARIHTVEARRFLESALLFWENQHLSEPDVLFNTPYTQQAVLTEHMSPFVEDNRVFINVLRYFGTRFETSVVLEYENNPLSYDLDLTIPISGDSNRIFSFVQNDESFDIDMKRKPVRWSAGRITFSYFDTVPHEVLHNQVSQYTDSSLLVEFRRLHSQNGILDEELLRRTSDDFIKAEELLVNAVAAAWGVRFIEEKSINVTPTYSTLEAERLSSLVRRYGPQRFIDQYVNNGPVEFLREHAA